MQLQSFTLATSLLVSILPGVALGAQETPKPTPAPGYVRFWNMLPAASGPMDLRRAGASAADAALFGKVPSCRYDSYLDLTPGQYHLAVTKTAAPGSPLKLLDIDLKANSYFTVLVSPTSQGPDVQAINDTNDPKAKSATLTVRNYFAGLTVDVFNGMQPIINALSYGQSYSVNGLPLERLELILRTKLPNGVAAESGAEADFKKAKRATLLIIPDSYNRFRPRVALDGRNF